MEFGNGDGLPFLSPLKCQVKPMNTYRESFESYPSTPLSGQRNQDLSSPYFRFQPARKIFQLEREAQERKEIIEADSPERVSQDSVFLHRRDFKYSFLI